MMIWIFTHSYSERYRAIMNGLWKKQAVELAAIILISFLSAPSGYAGFATGTPIGISDGWKTIEQMVSGSSALAGTLTGDESNRTVSWTNQYVLRKTEHFGITPITMVYITYGDNKELIVTPGHLFISKDGTLRQASTVYVGMELLQADGTETPIQSVTFNSYTGAVYTLAVVEVYQENSDGHLLNANGIVMGDYVLEINTRFDFDPNQGAFPPPENPAALGSVSAVSMADGAQQFPDVAYNSKENNYLAVWEHAV